MPCQDSDNSRHDSSQRVFSFKASQLRNAGTKCPFVRSRISKGCTLMFLSRIWGACIEIKYYRWGLHAVLYVAILSPISSLVWRYCMRWWCGHKQGRPAASAPSCQGCGLANLIQIQTWKNLEIHNKYRKIQRRVPGLWSDQPDPNTKPGKIYKYKQIQSANKR